MSEMSVLGESDFTVVQKYSQGPVMSVAKEKKKKKKRDKTKGKKKPGHELQKRGYSRISNSNTDKAQAEKSLVTPMKPTLKEHGDPETTINGQSKLRTFRRTKKIVTHNGEAVVKPEASSALLPGNEEVLSSLIQESLRWEGVLEDPVAEQQRIEIYKANRRKRYLAAWHRQLSNTAS